MPTPATYTYVYILTTESIPIHHYTGLTKNLSQRLNAHNTGKVKSTQHKRPWKIQTAIAFDEHNKAADFERYLKSHSGRAFASKRL